MNFILNEPKHFVNAIKTMGFIKGIKFEIMSIYDLCKLGYFKY